MSTRTDSIRALVFGVLPEAIAQAGGNGEFPFSARTLYYKVRPLLQQHTDRELKYTYFAYTLLPAFGSIPGLYYDPRGELHEPHTHKAVQLGTREVASYQIPSYAFDKVLYVEKKGLWPVLQQARIGEQHDMAIVVGEGYPVEAVRALLERAHNGGQTSIYCLHDADPYGYNIARVLGEETARMPDHDIDVTDLGLTVHDAITIGLPAEDFTRTAALPDRLTLTAQETEWFTGEQIGTKKWRCRRVELNAFSSPDLVAYINDRLTAVGASGKVIPPDDVLIQQSRQDAINTLIYWAEGWITRRFDAYELGRNLAERFVDQVVTNPGEWVTTGLDRYPTQSWHVAVMSALNSRIDDLAEDLDRYMEGVIGGAA